MKPTHTHTFTKRQISSTVATCTCGAFQHVDPKPVDIITEKTAPDYASSETAYGRTVAYDFAIKVF